MMKEKKYLCVMSDDFGMHPAVNEGIAEVFTDGLLTDTNLMPTCPAFEEAVRLTKMHNIPVGLHATFTCDWDIYSWGPLTNATSFTTSDGHFKTRVAEAWASADEEEAWTELLAQYDAIVSEGIQITHVGEHMGIDETGMFARIMAILAQDRNAPHKGHWRAYERPILHYAFDSRFETSGHSTDFDETKAWLRTKIMSLGPGYHLWVVHAAKDHPSLDELCSPDFHAVHWARTYRAIDQALLLDDDVAAWIQEQGIERIPIAQVPRAGGDTGGSSLFPS